MYTYNHRLATHAHTDNDARTDARTVPRTLPHTDAYTCTVPHTDARAYPNTHTDARAVSHTDAQTAEIAAGNPSPMQGFQVKVGIHFFTPVSC